LVVDVGHIVRRRFDVAGEILCWIEWERDEPGGMREWERKSGRWWKTGLREIDAQYKAHLVTAHPANNFVVLLFDQTCPAALQCAGFLRVFFVRLAQKVRFPDVAKSTPPGSPGTTPHVAGQGSYCHGRPWSI
jgi:hypothetical protein